MIRYKTIGYTFVTTFIVTACGGSTAVTPASDPVPVAVAPIPAFEADVPAIEPGRFDTGKMWTFENPPLDYFEEAYGFRPTREWLDGVRMSSLRLPNCTASFVSGTGLVMSNHHCAREAASAVTMEGEDLLTTGFYAATLGDERRVPDLYVDQLVEMHDVTDRIAISDDPAERGARSNAVRDSAAADLGLRCEVTSLYNGGKYSLYCFHRFDDVRLVFVPELQIGYFGGDSDNFTYPRYVIDASFFRVYEAGEPYEPEHHYGWNEDGAALGDAVFVIGNPGSTLRLNTVSQLMYRRDVQEPFTIRLLESRAAIFEHYMEHHPDQRPRYINNYFSIMNSLKLYRGRLEALIDPTIMGRKVGFEGRFRQAVTANPELNSEYGTIWDEIATIRSRMRRLSPTLSAFSTGGFLRSQILAVAQAMVEYAEAAQSGSVPDSVLQTQRARLQEVEFNIDLDHHMIEAQIEDAALLLGEDELFVVQALQGRTPQQAGREIADGSTAVTDSEQRTSLLADPSSILTSDDPAISLMRSVLPRFRETLAAYRGLTARETVLSQRLARGLFDVYGTSIAPDATFTLRIADGVVEGYDYNGTKAPYYTTFYGMYDRYYSHGGGEWELPQRWLAPGDEFDMSTPLNMVSTNDITGGNSGSPLINTAGEVVGLIFDGNIESLSGDFIYTTETARSVSVRAEAIIEALKNIYGANRIVNELLPNGN
ncbi:MAG: S46 family peptidase [Gemmatimonadota bacterium]|nr:S46 family peptidase [Gemmatimonadota bacterium]